MNQRVRKHVCQTWYTTAAVTSCHILHIILSTNSDDNEKIILQRKQSRLCSSSSAVGALCMVVLSAMSVLHS